MRAWWRDSRIMAAAARRLSHRPARAPLRARKIDRRPSSPASPSARGPRGQEFPARRRDPRRARTGPWSEWTAPPPRPPPGGGVAAIPHREPEVAEPEEKKGSGLIHGGGDRPLTGTRGLRVVQASRAGPGSSAGSFGTGGSWRCSGARRVGLFGGFGSWAGLVARLVGLMARSEVVDCPLTTYGTPPPGGAAEVRWAGARLQSLSRRAHDDPPALNHDG